MSLARAAGSERPWCSSRIPGLLHPPRIRQLRRSGCGRGRERVRRRRRGADEEADADADGDVDGADEGDGEADVDGDGDGEADGDRLWELRPPGVDPASEEVSPAGD